MNTKTVQFPRWLTGLVLAGLGLLAALKLGMEFYRLAWDTGPFGAIDLVFRYDEVQQWFAGNPVYGAMATATYPPASFIILWPVTGWASLEFIRWLWVLLSIASLVWLVRLLIAECDVRTWPERLLVALIPLSMNATGVAIGNGQPVFFLLPMLLTVLIFIRSGQPGWRTDLVVATLLLITLLKPTIGAPFFLILLLVAPGLRAAMICVLGYLLLTYVSTLFQPGNMFSLIGDWFFATLQINTEAAIELDYGSVHSWLTHAGLSDWNSAASLLFLALLAAWMYRARRADPWLIFGVTALVARTWAYHGVYDDMLIIIPIIAVLRHSREMAASGPMERSSLLLVSGSIFVMLLPARLFYFWESPWPALFAVAHLFFWLWLMIYLLVATEKQNCLRFRQE